MYSYVATWNIPRAQWADMEKANAADQKILEKGLSDGVRCRFWQRRDLGPYRGWNDP